MAPLHPPVEDLAQARRPQSLTAVLLAHMATDRRDALAARPDLERALAEIVAGGAGAWPHIPLPAADFVAFLGRRLAADAAVELDAIHAADLYLVCAYARGVPEASATVEARVTPRVKAALGKLGTPAHVVADVLQELRARLAEAQSAAPGRMGYSGRGDLVGWSCITAVREAGRRHKRAGEHRSLDAAPALLVSPNDDPELRLVLQTCEREFREAFRAALASLSSRERNILRYHFLEDLSIDQIGGLYGVHRATAARWIQRAREAVCLRTRELLAERLSLSREGFVRLLSVIDGQISACLAVTCT